MSCHKDAISVMFNNIVCYAGNLRINILINIWYTFPFIDIYIYENIISINGKDIYLLS